MSMLIRCGVVVTLVSFVMFGCAGPGKPEAGHCGKAKKVAPCEKAKKVAPCEKAKKIAPCDKAKKAAAREPRPTEAEKGMPFGIVWRVDKAPVVDGVIKQDEWGKPLAGQLADNASGKAVAWATTVWLTYDKDNLYLAFRLDEPEMDELICMVTERDGDVWQDDGMEIFLDPTNTKNEDVYYHIMVNAAGVVADRQGAPNSMGLDWVWDAEGIKAKTTRGADYWTIEMAIPLADMEAKGDQAGKHWAANFCRTRHGNLMESAWSSTGPYSFHAPEKLGHLGFSK